MVCSFSKIFITIFAYFFILNNVEIKAQSYQPAVEHSSLLNMRFYPQSGGFLLEGLQIVFPPADDPSFELIISSKDGNKITSLPLRLERWDDFPAFGILKPNGMPGNINIGKPGHFKLAVLCNGKVITELPFELKVNGGDDPYNPQKNYTREGIWRTVGYLSKEINKEEDALKFNFWMSKSELPEKSKKTLCTLHLMKDEKEIASTNSPFSVHSDDWIHYRISLFKPKELGGKNFTFVMLESEEGNYRIDIKNNGIIIKSYSIKISNGKTEVLKRSQLGYKPSTDFLSPKLIDTSSGSNSSYKMIDAYWIEAGI